MSKYIGFDGVKGIAQEFEVGGFRSYYYGEHKEPEALPPDFPTDEQIIVAAYEHEGYEGSAFVLFEREGKLFEAHGSHCSCYGLEDQWSPEETTPEALRMRLETGDYGVVNTDAVKALIRAYLENVPSAYQGA